MKHHAATPRVLSALKAGQRISPQIALTRWGVFRLASIVHKLRKAGHDIKTEMVFESGARYAEYYIV